MTPEQEVPSTGCEETAESLQVELYEHVRLTADDGQAPERVDKFVADRLEDTSRSRVQLAIRRGFLRVNGKPVKPSELVQPGDVVTLELPYEQRGKHILPQDIPLNIVYEDDSLLVVDKAAGMVVHPGHGNYEGTLVNALAHYLKIDPTNKDERLGLLVHRIDRYTSGLLVVPKTREAHARLSEQFFDHSIDRLYTAIAWGDMEGDEGVVERAIARDPNERTRFRSFDDQRQGKWAVTHWKVLERFGFVSLVQCRLETGRTHQIRVHLSWAGHPIFGDPVYGGTEIREGTIYAKYKQFIRNCLEVCPRQALHAATLGFTHPATGERLHFVSPMPADMQALLEKWRRYAQATPPEDPTA